MRDSTKTLNFKINRLLGFDQSREVDFSVNRDLLFDQDRDLIFNVDRNLDIRARGVVFRGYVCPVCGASVADDAPKCDECGVDFVKAESKPKIEKKRRKPKTKNPQSKSSKRANNVKKTFQCPVCGQAMYVGTKQCPGCQIEF